jgi:hypothetical protein
VLVTLPLHRKCHPWLHLSGKAKLAERKKMREPKAPRQNAAKTRPRRERPRPLTHRASRALRGRSRLAGARIAPGVWAAFRVSEQEDHKGEKKDGNRKETT